MKQVAARTGLLVLLTGAALAVLVLLLWSGGGGQQTARAYPGLTVAIDMDPSTTTDTNGNGVYSVAEGVDVGTFEDCVDVTNGHQFDVVVSVLDVENLTAFLTDIEYDGSVVKIIASYTGVTESDLPTMFLSAQFNSEVVNTSENIFDDFTGLISPSDTDGKYEAAGFDSSHTDNGDTGSGTLVRLTLEAISPGVSPFSFDSRDIDGDTIQDRGVTLVDVNAATLNDANLDGFFDGPFINADSIIAVDQPDSNGNGISDICDPDMDGDGYDNDVDNCPEIYNPSQSDVDGDGLGDPCDTWDADGDGHANLTETTYGSDTLDPLSTPEVCDGLDNDGDTAVDEGFDYSRPNTGIPSTGAPNGVPDCTEDVHSDDDATANPSDPDDDGDGTDDVDEHAIATDSLIACHNGIGLPDWPEDFNDSKVINVVDLNKLLPPPLGSWGLTTNNEPYTLRTDLDHNGVINIVDLNRLLPAPLGVWGTTCSTP